MPDIDVDLDLLSSRRVGRVLAGKWHLVEMLGSGAGGAVYLAVGPNDVTAAVKMLHPDLAKETTMRARFVREAYVANKIDHPGVVRVIEDGVDGGLPYIVMDLLEGETLEARLARKGQRLPIAEVLWAADHTLQVLSAAHAKGIVHRDIKPGNLFLTHDRRLMVLDFGIARLGEARDQTMAGTVLGTLAFMPPEQARGDVSATGVRSDLWSVGATMFNLLSGRLVREDADTAKLLREAGSAKVQSLREVAPELPIDLIELVDMALSVESASRWPTAKSMRRAVRLVNAKILRGSARGKRATDDDDEVDEPDFGLIVTREVEAPPPSRALDTERRIQIASDAAVRAAAMGDDPLADTRVSASPPTAATIQSGPAPTDTLQSDPWAVPTLQSEGASEPAPKPRPATVKVASARAPKAGPAAAVAPHATVSKRPAVPAWAIALALAIAIVAVGLILASVRR